MPKGYVNLEQIATIDLEVVTVLKILHCRQKGLTRALMPDSP